MSSPKSGGGVFRSPLMPQADRVKPAIRDKAISRTDDVRRFMRVSVGIREWKGLLRGKIVPVESPRLNISADIHLFYDKFVTG